MLKFIPLVNLRSNVLCSFYITDLFGARIIVRSHQDLLEPEKEKDHVIFNPSEIEVLDRSWKWESEEDKSSPSLKKVIVRYKIDDKDQPDTGYWARHYDCTLEAKEEQNQYKCKLNKRKFELQLKTALSNAWGEISHDEIYKPDQDASELVQYRNAELSSVLRLIERSINDLFILDDQPIYKNYEHLLNEWEKVVYACITTKYSGLQKQFTLRSLKTIYGEMQQLTGTEVAKIIDSLEKDCDNEPDTLVKAVIQKVEDYNNPIELLKRPILDFYCDHSSHEERVQKYQNLDFKMDKVCDFVIPYMEVLKIAEDSIFNLNFKHEFNIEDEILESSIDDDRKDTLKETLNGFCYKRQERDPWLKNTSILSIQKMTQQEDNIILEAIPAAYFDQIMTNQAVERWIPCFEKKLWDIIHPVAKGGNRSLTPFDNPKNFLVNSIGAACLVEGNDNKAILCQRTPFHGAMPDLIGPNISWPVNWPWDDDTQKDVRDIDVREVLQPQLIKAAAMGLGLDLSKKKWI